MIKSKKIVCAMLAALWLLAFASPLAGAKNTARDDQQVNNLAAAVILKDKTPVLNYPLDEEAYFTLKEDDVVIIISIDETFAYIRYGDRRGFIKHDAYRRTARVSFPADCRETTIMRKTPQADGAPIMRIKYGQRVETLSLGEGYIRIRVDENVGYVLSECFYLDIDSSYQALVYMPPGYTKAYLMSAASGGEVLGSYKAGTAVTILSMGKSRHQVRIGDKKGYMSVIFLRPKSVAK